MANVLSGGLLGHRGQVGPNWFERARLPESVVLRPAVGRAIEVLGATFALDPTSAWYLIEATAQASGRTAREVADDFVRRCVRR